MIEIFSSGSAGHVIRYFRFVFFVMHSYIVKNMESHAVL